MELTNLSAISPIDGRYRKQVQHLDEYFSEYALMKYRVLVEIEYFLFLADKKFFSLSKKAEKHLRRIAEEFGPEDAQEIKQIEYTTNHDVKAVEYYLKNALDKSGAKEEDYRKEIKGTTAGLVIGDRAFEQRKLSTFFYDLGAEWKKITGQPFVFAVWISNKKLPEDFIKIFNEANAAGLTHIDEIAASQHFDLYDLKKYYTLHMNYLLDDKKKKAMQYFLQVIKEAHEVSRQE